MIRNAAILLFFAMAVAHTGRLMGVPQPADTGQRLPAGAFMRNDTLFFLDDEHVESDGFRTILKVYVETDRNSKAFRRFCGVAAPDSEYNRSAFEANLRHLRKKVPEALKRHDLHGCPTMWLPLCSVGGRYYFDGLNPYPISITDSLFVHQYMDGPWPARIDGFELSEPGHYRFLTTSLNGERNEIDLCMIDTLRRIAVLRELHGSDATFRLLAASEPVDRFDLLVWECNDLPNGDEIPVDTIDFDRLLAPYQLKTSE